LDTLVWLKNETDVWFEITTLLIPDEMIRQKKLNRSVMDIENLGDSVPLTSLLFILTLDERQRTNS